MLEKQQQIIMREKLNEILSKDLENEIRNRLFLTDTERQLYQYQEFVEIVERLLNVSASREDMQRYRQLAEVVTLSGIIQGLDRNLGGTTAGVVRKPKRWKRPWPERSRFTGWLTSGTPP
jgi:hypothetical protein